MPHSTAAMELAWAGRDRLRPVGITAFLMVSGAIALRLSGVPTANLHGPLHFLGIMDPLCGGTRATFLLMAGDIEAAALYNPVVFPLAVLTLAVLVRAGYGVLSGRWLEVRLSRTAWRVLLVTLAVAILALAIRQQLHAGLLMQGWPPPTPA